VNDSKTMTRNGRMDIPRQTDRKAGTQRTDCPLCSVPAPLDMAIQQSLLRRPTLFVSHSQVLTIQVEGEAVDDPPLYSFFGPRGLGSCSPNLSMYSMFADTRGEKPKSSHAFDFGPDSGSCQVWLSPE
jgi:hypothetical protein